MTTLYNLTKDLIELEAMVIEAFEERGGLSQEEQDKIEIVISEIRAGSKEKLAGYAKLLLGLKARQEMVANEAKRLRAKSEALKNTQNRLKSAVQFYMETAELKKIEAGAFNFTLCKNGGKAPLLMDCLPEALPKKYQVKTISANNDELRKALKDNKEIEGVKLGERGVHVLVR